MEFSFFYGIQVAIYISIVISGIWFLLIFLNSLFGLSLVGWLFMLFFTLSLTVGLFLVFFPIINIIFQFNQIKIELIMNDFKDKNFFMMMFTGFIIGYKILLFFKKSMIHFRPTLKNVNASKLEAEMYKEERKLLDKVNFNLEMTWKSLSQYFLFGVSICLLYFIGLSNIHSDISLMILTIINFMIFFFVDDWVIISEYTDELDSRILKSHEIRMHIANIIIIGLINLLIWMEFPLNYFLLGLLISFICIYWRYLARYEN